VLGVAALLSACAMPGHWLTPLPPASGEARHQVRQQLTLDAPERSLTLQSLLKSSVHGLTLIIMSDAGQRMFTLQWKPGQPAPRVFGQAPKGMTASGMLADLQLALWPETVLRSGLPSQFRLEDIGATRLLWRGENLVWLRVSEGKELRNNSMMIYNLPLGYRLRIQPLILADTRP
jgi:hypothetical protein